MSNFPPVLPHGDIEELFQNVFILTGQIRIESDPPSEFSRNMVIIRQGTSLTLVNSIRLDDSGLAQLDALGQVRNVIKLGAFHGRDDAFYLERYQPNLWAPPGMTYSRGETTDKLLTPELPGPVNDMSAFVFNTPESPEAALVLNKHGGILITCDSIQNMLGPDKYFNDHATEWKERLGFFNRATVGPGWLKFAKPDIQDFAALKALRFKHLISAHGDPLLDHAHEAVSDTLTRLFKL